MQTTAYKSEAVISDAIKIVEMKSKVETRGKWLEDLVAKTAPHIAEWDVSECWIWKDWPDREDTSAVY